MDVVITFAAIDGIIPFPAFRGRYHRHRFYVICPVIVSLSAPPKIHQNHYHELYQIVTPKTVSRHQAAMIIPGSSCFTVIAIGQRGRIRRDI